MNASQFMDKQIMELSASGAQNGDLLDLLNPSEKHRINGDGSGSGTKKEDMLPSYDFQPIRSVVSSASPAVVDGGRELGSADSATTSSNLRERKYSSSEANDPYKGIHEKNKEAYDTNILGEFDRSVKKYADKLMHALEGVSSRLSQLEGRTHNLEGAFDELKLTISTHNGSSDGKLRQLENILREVQIGVQVLRDKQEIVEAQIQLAKLQASKVDHHQPDVSLPGQTTTPPSQSSLPSVQPSQQSLLPPPSQSSLPPPPQGLIPSLPTLPALPPPPPPQTQFPSVPAMPPRESYFFPPNQQEPPQQQYHLPPQQQRPRSQNQQYTQNMSPPQLHHPDESLPYISSIPQIYPPGIRPFTGPVPGPQFPTGSGGLSPSHYNSSMKQSQQAFFSSSVTGPGSSSYPRLPTAQLLPPQTAPAGSGSSGERVPVDDVVDKVTSMGFPRDIVRSTVRRLTENGQNVDLNVVLDKLMNDGENPSQKAWFVR